MVSCPRYSRCNLPGCLSMEAALRIWQSLYCEAAWERCARRRRLEAGEDVPARMLPDGRCSEGAAGPARDSCPEAVGRGTTAGRQGRLAAPGARYLDRAQPRARGGTSPARPRPRLPPASGLRRSRRCGTATGKRLGGNGADARLGGAAHDRRDRRLQLRPREQPSQGLHGLGAHHERPVGEGELPRHLGRLGAADGGERSDRPGPGGWGTPRGCGIWRPAAARPGDRAPPSVRPGQACQSSPR